LKKHKKRFWRWPSGWLTKVKSPWVVPEVTSLSDHRSISGKRVRPWQAPLLVSGTEEAGGGDERISLPTADQIETMHKEAREEGFAQGLREGMDAAREQLEARFEQLDSMLDCLSRPLHRLEARVEEELVLLTLAIAKQLIRRELKADPAHVVGVIRAAVAQLPVSGNRLTIELHPEDAVLVREVLNLDEEAESGWRIREVPTLSRGGCRIDNSESHIDATVETRINQIAASLFGGERAVDGE
jgi:flagellar assembly protein FliH